MYDVVDYSAHIDRKSPLTLTAIVLKERLSTEAYGVSTKMRKTLPIGAKYSILYLLMEVKKK